MAFFYTEKDRRSFGGIMNWIESLQKAIRCIEDNLLDELDFDQIASECGWSSSHLQRGFQIVTGMTMSQYARNRRLYKAARELAENPQLKLIDAAVKYGYDSPEAFSRAFRKFHGVLPSEIRQHPKRIRIFLPLQIQLHVRGGQKMDVKFQSIPAFELIGRIYPLSDPERTFEEIPQLWADFMSTWSSWMNGNGQQTPQQQAIWQNNIGEFGLCMDRDGKTEYMIAGKYRGGDVPEGLSLRSVPAMKWAMFTASGAAPQGLQTCIRQVFSEWIPAHPQYEVQTQYALEYYPIGDTHAVDYATQFWVPIIEKTTE